MENYEIRRLIPLCKILQGFAGQFASNVGGKTKASSGAPEKQTAKATYTAVQRDFDNNYYAYFDESDLPEGVTKTELEENWFKDMNYYPVKAL